jgi:hypothetical protein
MRVFGAEDPSPLCGSQERCEEGAGVTVRCTLRYEGMIRMLVDKGADVNALDRSRHRPLTYALQMDDQKWAEVLKKSGAQNSAAPALTQRSEISMNISGATRHMLCAAVFHTVPFS